VIGESVALTDLLARWLPAQRWCPGSTVTGLRVVSDVTLLAGDPELRHLIVEVAQGHGSGSYQVLIGLRDHPPASARHVVIGTVDGRTAYDALHDPELAAVLIHGIAQQRTADTLRFAAEPAPSAGPGTGTGTGSAAPGPRAAGDWTSSRVLTAEQSNTSVVFGEAAILKVVRRLFPGVNPDLEVAAALARLGSARVPAPYGRVDTELGGEPVLLAVLSRYLPNSADGWSLAATTLRRLFADPPGAHPEPAHPEPVQPEQVQPEPIEPEPTPPEAVPPEPARPELARAPSAQPQTDHQSRQVRQPDPPRPGDFADEARLLGQATAEIHVDLASAFGSRPATTAELAEFAARMNSQLDQALTEIPELAEHESMLRARFAEVGRLDAPVQLQRIHGDYHLGQVLRATDGWVALDFEGEPSVPLRLRRAFAPALRDVAGMLRSFDYAARHQLIDRPVSARQRRLADDWASRCQAQFRMGYAEAGGADPVANEILLRALTLDKAVYEVIYESRLRPSWLPVPLGYIASV
jgi:maltokinase